MPYVVSKLCAILWLLTLNDVDNELNGTGLKVIPVDNPVHTVSRTGICFLETRLTLL